MTVQKYGPWWTLWFCVHCKNEISYSARMYSHGRCPKCGYKAPWSSTVVKTFERACRTVTTYPDGHRWWKFWQRGEQHEEMQDVEVR